MAGDLTTPAQRLALRKLKSLSLMDTIVECVAAFNVLHIPLTCVPTIVCGIMCKEAYGKENAVWAPIATYVSKFLLCNLCFTSVRELDIALSQ
jgi:hypothetical protein